MEFFAFISLGMIAGFVAGLLGVGGGIVTVPFMSLLLLPYLQFPAENIMHIAVASSLAAIIPTAIMSIYGHHKQAGIDWSMAKQLTPGLLFGALLGAIIATRVSADFLQIVFSIFLFIAAIYMLFTPVSWVKPSMGIVKVSSFASLPIAFLSAMMGVGGGTMTVPYLLWRGMTIRYAIAMSAYCGLPIAVSSSVTFIVIQFMDSSESTIEFLYLPAIIGISFGSVFFAPIGATLTHKLPVRTIKRLFSVLLIVASVELYMNSSGVKIAIQ